VGKRRGFLHAEMRTIKAVVATARIPSFDADVPQGVFIAPARLTPRILVGKHKIKGAASIHPT
jgi:hypothetical protein